MLFDTRQGHFYNVLSKWRFFYGLTTLEQFDRQEDEIYWWKEEAVKSESISAKFMLL